MLMHMQKICRIWKPKKNFRILFEGARWLMQKIGGIWKPPKKFRILSTIPPFGHHSAFPPFRHSAIIPSAIPPFRHSAIPPFCPPFCPHNRWCVSPHPSSHTQQETTTADVNNSLPDVDNSSHSYISSIAVNKEIITDSRKSSPASAYSKSANIFSKWMTPDPQTPTLEPPVGASVNTSNTSTVSPITPQPVASYLVKTVISPKTTLKTAPLKAISLLQPSNSP